MRLQHLAARGLKARDFRLDFADLTVLVGENGRSKSAVLEAIHLLALGYVPGVDKTGDGILSLARDREIVIEGTFGIEERGTWHLSRSWKRSRDGRVSETIKSSHGPKGGSLAEQRAWITQRLGGFAEAWAPGEILNLSPAKLRSRLLSRIPQSEISIASIVPAECPSWALPSQTDVSAVDWSQLATKRARQELDRMQGELRRVREKLDEDLGDAWREERPVAPMQEQLAALRQELIAVRMRELSAQKAEKAKAQFDTMVQPEPGGSVVVARYARAVTIAADGECRKFITQQVDRVSAAIAAVEVARGDIAPLRAHPAVSEADVIAAEVAFTDIRTDIERLRGTLADIRAERAAYASPQLRECPHCKADLVAHLEKRCGELDADYHALSDELTVLLAVETEAAQTFEAAQAGFERSVREVELAQLEAVLADTRVDADAALANYPTFEEMDAAEEATSKALTAAELRERECAAFEAARAKFDAAIQERDAYPASKADAAELEANIRDLEQEIATIGAENERLKQRVHAEADLKNFEDLVLDRKDWLAQFENIQTDLLTRAKAWLEKRMTEGLGGSPVVVELVDARGNDDCRLTVDGVDAATLSDGEKATFIASLIVTLAEASDAPWRPLLLDRFEHVSKSFREPFMRALLSAVQNGRISQAMLAGCQDTTPEIEGVDVIDTETIFETFEKVRDRSRRALDANLESEVVL